MVRAAQRGIATVSDRQATRQTAMLQTFVIKYLRSNACAIWQEAADVAEWCATDLEAGRSRMLDGPEACRQMAEVFRGFARHLEETAL